MSSCCGPRTKHSNLKLWPGGVGPRAPRRGSPDRRRPWRGRLPGEQHPRDAVGVEQRDLLGSRRLYRVRVCEHRVGRAEQGRGLPVVGPGVREGAALAEACDAAALPPVRLPPALAEVRPAHQRCTESLSPPGRVMRVCCYNPAVLATPANPGLAPHAGSAGLDEALQAPRPSWRWLLCYACFSPTGSP